MTNAFMGLESMAPGYLNWTRLILYIINPYVGFSMYYTINSFQCYFEEKTVPIPVISEIRY